jgi:hypothetical protein
VKTVCCRLCFSSECLLAVAGAITMSSSIRSDTTFSRLAEGWVPQDRRFIPLKWRMIRKLFRCAMKCLVFGKFPEPEGSHDKPGQVPETSRRVLGLSRRKPD